MYGSRHQRFRHIPKQQEQEECVKEVEMLALLDCPYIIKYYDSFVEQVCVQHYSNQSTACCHTQHTTCDRQASTS